jgi:ABC-2 type transport system permease protein
MVRSLIPLALLITVGLIFGVNIPGGIAGVGMLVVSGVLLALISGEWSIGVAYRTKTTQSAPLTQMLLFLAIFLSTAMMPLALLTGWVKAVAEVNPMTDILGTARQGFLGDVTWDATWPGLVALVLGAVALGYFAYRGLKKVIP